MEYDIFDKKAKVYFKEKNWENVLEKMRNDINLSDFVYITTFSLPGNSCNNVFKELIELSKTKKVKIVSNAPSDKKNDYKSKLNPTRYCIRNFKSYLNLNNHSKMIITQSAVYIGSQNLVSTSNFELGTIFYDREVVKIALEFYQKLIDDSDSIELVETELTNILIELAECKRDISECHRDIKDMLYEEEEISKYQYVPHWNESVDNNALKDGIKKLKEALFETKERLYKVNYLVDVKLNKLIDGAILECDENLFMERYKKVSELEDISSSYIQDKIEQRVVENTMTIPDELESFDKTQCEIYDKVFSEFEEPINRAWSDFFNFDIKVRGVISVIEETLLRK